MTLHWIDWLIIAGFLLLSLIIGLIYRSRAGKDLNSFFLGGRNMPWLVAGVSMVATTFAADTPLAVTELVGQSGISGNWLWWSYLAGGMLTTFFFARLWRRAGILTEIEFIELRYAGKQAAFLRGFKALYLGLFMNVLIIGWVNLALMAILQEFFGITGVDLIIYTGLAMLIAAIYTAISGLWGVAVTDTIQFVIAMTGTIIMAVLVVNSPEIGGIAGLKAKLPPSSLNFFPAIGTSGASGATTLSISLAAFLAYAGVQWWSSWYPGQEPGGGGYVAQRMMSTRTEKGAVYATLFFQVAHYCLRPWPWILVGLSCTILYPQLAGGDLKLGYVMAMKEFLPTGLKGLLLVAFLSAYLSTISTQLNWGAGYIINDFYRRFLKPDASDKHFVNASRWCTLIIMAAGLFATTQMTSISAVWSFIIECGAGLGLVLILRWYWWRINAWSEIAATVTPFVAYAVSRFYLDWVFPQSLFFTVGVTTISWLIVTFLTRPEPAAKLQHFYDRVRPDGIWGSVSAETVKPERQKNLLFLGLCWLCGIILTYGILFATGKIILQEWKPALIYCVIVLIAAAGLNFALKRTRVLH